MTDDNGKLCPDLDNLEDTCNQYLDQLFESIYGTTDITNQQKTDAVTMSMLVRITEFTVSASAKRQVVSQYEPNDYFSAMKNDLSGLCDFIEEELKSTPKEKMLARFFELKQTFINVLRQTFKKNDHFLRTQLEEAIETDGGTRKGRFAKNNSRSPR